MSPWVFLFVEWVSRYEIIAGHPEPGLCRTEYKDGLLEHYHFPDDTNC